MTTKILEHSCAASMLSRALHRVAEDVQAHRLFDVDEHGAVNAFLVRIQTMFAERGLRISERTYQTCVLAATGSSQAEIARQLSYKNQVEVSNVMMHFRVLLTAQMPNIVERYPMLTNLDGATTASQLFGLASKNLGSYMELLHDMKEGTL